MTTASAECRRAHAALPPGVSTRVVRDVVWAARRLIDPPPALMAALALMPAEAVAYWSDQYRARRAASEARHRAKNVWRARARSAAWYAANREQANEQHRERRAANPERVRERDRAWYAANRERISEQRREWDRAWRDANRERYNEQHREQKRARARAARASDS